MSTIFVSSTFKDMQYERDALQEQVLPAINEYAAKYGQSISFCDLRWGINTEELDSEVGSQKVLDVCLDEIDRSDNPMIVILGERYGWIPSESLIEDVATRKKLRLDHLRKSVTALEIEYGAFTANRGKGKTLFYFRDIADHMSSEYSAEDQECKQLLSELKDKIRNIKNATIRTYSVKWEDGHVTGGLDYFCKMVEEDLKDCLLPAWEAYNNLSPFEKELATHGAFINEKAALFSARKHLAKAYLSALEEDKHCLILKGKSGVGKSTLFSYLAKETEKNGYTVLAYESGLTTGTSTALGLLKNYVFGLEEILNLSHCQENQSKELRQRLNELCIEAGLQKKKIILMADAADQLFPDDLRDDLIFIPEELSDNVKFIMTCTSDFQTKGRKFYTIPLVEKEETKLILQSLAESSNKELSGPVIEAILQKEAVNTPLYISFLFQRLVLMNRKDFEKIQQYGDGMEAITKYQLEIVQNCPDALEDMSVELMQIVAERINKNLIAQILMYIVFSRHGLRLDDLKSILKNDFIGLDFSHFVIYMKDCFILRDDGRYDFSHKSIKNGLKKLYWKQRETIHTQLFRYLKSLNKDDILRCNEFAYHCVLSCKDQELTEYINEITEKNTSDKITSAAKNLYEICQNYPERCISLIKSQGGSSLNFINFIHRQLCTTFGSSDREYEILQKIRSVLYFVTMEFFKNNLSIESLQVVWSVLREYGNTLAPEKALKCYNKCKEMADFLISKELSAKNRLYLALSCEDIALTYGNTNDLCDQEVRKTVLPLYQTALKIHQELAEETDQDADYRSLCSCYIKLADFFFSQSDIVDDISVIKASTFEYYNKALEVSQFLLKRERNTDALRQLAHLYDKMAYAYSDFSGDENRKKALECCQKRLEIIQEIAKKQNTYINNKLLAEGQEELADALLDLRDINRIPEAYKLYYNALQIRKTLAMEVNAKSTRISYADTLQRAANLLALTTVPKHWKTAEQYYRESLRLFKSVSTEDYKIKQHYAMVCNRLYDVLIQQCERDPELSLEEKNLLKEEANHYCREAEKIFTETETYDTAFEMAEVLEVLSYMEKKDKDIIPYKTIRLYEDMALRSYEAHLDPAIDLENQGLGEGTTALLASFVIKYWCATEEERDEMREAWEENEKKYQEEKNKRES